MFRKLSLKDDYSSEIDNIYEDFFLPVLNEAKSYKRAVGFFSLGVLLNAPAAMSKIIQSGGRIELLFAKLVSAEDLEAIREGLKDPFEEENFPDFESLISENLGSLLEYRIKLLAWLFASGHLEMKVAVRPKGMFHQKIGIVEDGLGDRISFSGSMNETMSALDPDFNSEEITVFRSWNEGQRGYVDTHLERFDRLWSGDTGSRTVVCSIPEAISEGLSVVAERFPGQPDNSTENARVRDFFEKRARNKASKPSVPKEIHGSPFKMREHQLEALRKWAENGYNGILELATGAGKTITAIYAATRVMEQNDGIALVISVPYQDLADQWCRELQLFNIFPLRCYGSRMEWQPELNSYVHRNLGRQSETIALVVVNRTLTSDHFQALSSQLDPQRTFFIGDECHHHGSLGFKGKLLEGSKFRLGLSATPYHYLDDDANARLKSVYNKSVFKYNLGQAVEDKVLTPYEYFPIPVELTAEESEEYLDLSDQIARAFVAKNSDKRISGDERLKALLMKRSRLVGSAQNKLIALERLLEQAPMHSHSLFYCSDGRTSVGENNDVGAEQLEHEVKQRHAVAQLLKKRGCTVSPFTSEESRAQRREILRRFKDGETEALVAIRCLDEGIDVPACRTAYLLASSRNPRQFIQRRGRILRRAPNKEKATIYDFVVVLQEGHASSESRASDFLKNELERVADFARNSLYPASSVEPLMPWLRRYDLEHYAI